MTNVRLRGEAIRRFIIENVEKHPSDIAKITAAKFAVTRQAINKHVQKLVSEKALVQEGKTRRQSYALTPLLSWEKEYPIVKGLTEDRPWSQDIVPSLGSIPENVKSIWHYGFTEMFNNAIDHSEGTEITVEFEKTAYATTISIFDDGVGIFKKIQRAAGLLNERHAVLELAKGKFTTDPKNHSGEGIFFTSRMFDDFQILSGSVYFSHKFAKSEDWILEQPKETEGTMVTMTLNNHTSRTTKKVFDTYSEGEDYGFTKTIVPVKLTEYGDDNLVSRSQAKRLLVRIDRFKTVVLDFSGVASIGQAFADEIFRVFASQHPEVEIIDIKANADVKRMITRALTHEG